MRVSATRVPERLVRAVDSLDLRPDHRVLEVGCGRGVAAALVCERLQGGHLLGVDRSATAVAAAVARNAQHVHAGTATFRCAPLAELDPAALDPFDTMVAVNVNLFWVGPARAELDLLAGLLSPEGRLHLVYEPPGASQLPRMTDRLLAHLDAAGWTASSDSAPLQRSVLLTVTAERPA